MDVRFFIPTYKRPKVVTAETLLRLGMEPGRITIGTQTVDDCAMAMRMYEGANILLDGSINCAAGNRNQLLNSVAQSDKFIMLMDDDVSWLADSRDEFHEKLERSVNIMLKGGLTLLEWDTHGFNADGRLPSIWCGWGYSGCVMMLDLDRVSEDTRFDSDMRIFDDMDFMLNLLTHGGRIAISTALRAKTAPSLVDGKDESAGGCASIYAQNDAISKHEGIIYEKYGRFGYIAKPSNSHREYVWLWGPTGYEEE